MQNVSRRLKQPLPSQAVSFFKGTKQRERAAAKQLLPGEVWRMVAEYGHLGNHFALAHSHRSAYEALGHDAAVTDTMLRSGYTQEQAHQALAEPSKATLRRYIRSDWHFKEGGNPSLYMRLPEGTELVCVKALTFVAQRSDTQTPGPNATDIGRSAEREGAAQVEAPYLQVLSGGAKRFDWSPLPKEARGFYALCARGQFAVLALHASPQTGRAKAAAVYDLFAQPPKKLAEVVFEKPPTFSADSRWLSGLLTTKSLASGQVANALRLKKKNALRFWQLDLETRRLHQVAPDLPFSFVYSSTSAAAKKAKHEIPHTAVHYSPQHSHAVLFFPNINHQDDGYAIITSLRGKSRGERTAIKSSLLWGLPVGDGELLTGYRHGMHFSNDEKTLTLFDTYHLFYEQFDVTMRPPVGVKKALSVDRVPYMPHAISDDTILALSPDFAPAEEESAHMTLRESLFKRFCYVRFFGQDGTCLSAPEKIPSPRQDCDRAYFRARADRVRLVLENACITWHATGPESGRSSASAPHFTRSAIAPWRLPAEILARAESGMNFTQVMGQTCAGIFDPLSERKMFFLSKKAGDKSTTPFAIASFHVTPGDLLVGCKNDKVQISVHALKDGATLHGLQVCEATSLDAFQKEAEAQMLQSESA